MSRRIIILLLCLGLVGCGGESPLISLADNNLEQDARKTGQEGLIYTLSTFWMMFFPQLHKLADEGIKPSDNKINFRSFMQNGLIRCSGLEEYFQNTTNHRGQTITEFFSASCVETPTGVTIKGGLPNNTKVYAPSDQDPLRFNSFGLQIQFDLSTETPTGDTKERLKAKIMTFVDFISEYTAWDKDLVKPFIPSTNISTNKVWQLLRVTFYTGLDSSETATDPNDVFGARIFSNQNFDLNAFEVPRDECNFICTGPENIHPMATPSTVDEIVTAVTAAEEGTSGNEECLSDFYFAVQTIWPIRTVYYPSIRLEPLSFNPNSDEFPAEPADPDASSDSGS